MVIISKYPFIKPIKSFIFSRITRGDEIFNNKGILLAKINHPIKGNIYLANSHLGAVSFDPTKKTYKQKHILSKRKQIEEMVDFLKAETDPKLPLILGCDFNTHDHPHIPGTENFNLEEFDGDYLFLKDQLSLIDSYRSHFKDKNREEYLGYTYSTENDFVDQGYNKRFMQNERLDYIFISKREDVLIENSEIVFKERPDFLNSLGNKKLKWQKHLSDHFGVLSEFRFL